HPLPAVTRKVSKILVEMTRRAGKEVSHPGMSWGLTLSGWQTIRPLRYFVARLPNIRRERRGQGSGVALFVVGRWQVGVDRDIIDKSHRGRAESSRSALKD